MYSSSFWLLCCSDGDSDPPVSCNLDIESHLDIEKILVLPEMTCHLTLGGPQVVLKLCHAVLQKSTATWETKVKPI